MKNIINYYYDFDIYNFRNCGDNCIFKYKNENYLFYKLKQYHNINNMIYILNNTKLSSKIHTLILNKNKEILTFDGNNYNVLFLINIKNNKNIELVDVIDFLNENKVYNLKSFRLNWVDLWIKKIDFLEHYLNNKDNVKYDIRVVCDYYIGMAENALIYLKKILHSNDSAINNNYSLCHKRFHGGYTLEELYNPINLIVDHYTRDISEYIRILFFDKNYNLDILNYIISCLELSYIDYQLIMARLIFPTFFFDKLDMLYDGELKTEDILKLYDDSLEYERFLYMVYFSIKKTRNINLPVLDWLEENI